MRVANEALELSTALFAALTKLSLSGRICPVPSLPTTEFT
jgi:hypothetical protein